MEQGYCFAVFAEVEAIDFILSLNAIKQSCAMARSDASPVAKVSSFNFRI